MHCNVNPSHILYETLSVSSLKKKHLPPDDKETPYLAETDQPEQPTAGPWNLHPAPFPTPHPLLALLTPFRRIFCLLAVQVTPSTQPGAGPKRLRTAAPVPTWTRPGPGARPPAQTLQEVPLARQAPQQVTVESETESGPGGAQQAAARRQVPGKGEKCFRQKNADRRNSKRDTLNTPPHFHSWQREQMTL